MTDYKVGDTVYLKGTIIELDMDDEGLETLVELEQNGKEWVNPRGLSLCAPSDKTYEEGLQDAWELARKIAVLPSKGGMADEEIQKVFGTIFFDDVLSELTPQEALAKLKAYEAQTIKVGDVVECGNCMFVVTHIYDDRFLSGIMENGDLYSNVHVDNARKTGKHIDIKSLLGQIRSE